MFNSLKYCLPGLILILCFGISSKLKGQEIHLDVELILDVSMDGDAIDRSGNNVPTMVQGPVLTSDRFGNPESAYLFDGIDDLIQLNNNDALILSEAYTISLWARIDGPSQAELGSNSLFEQREPIEASDNFPDFPVVIHFNAQQGNETRHVVRSSSGGNSQTVRTSSPETGTWHHYIAMVDLAGSMYLFIDGQIKGNAQLANPGNYYEGVTYVSIGGHHSSEDAGIVQRGGAFNGAIDEFRVYSRALNLCEIEALYSGQLTMER